MNQSIGFWLSSFYFFISLSLIIKCENVSIQFQFEWFEYFDNMKALKHLK